MNQNDRTGAADAEVASRSAPVTSWFFNASPEARPSVRLVCVPYAGGSAAAFRSWGPALGPGVEVLGVQLPGRSWRFKEPPNTDLASLAEDVSHAVLGLTDLPLAIFGHSMGAWLGFEVARRLEARGRGPVILFASGRQAPSVGVREPYLHRLEDDAFVREIQERYDGIPDEVLRHPELMELLLPSLRADIEALERHVHVPAEPLSCPIVAVLGDSDRIVAAADVRAWGRETSVGFDMRTLPGGHFYFATNPRPLLDAIRRSLSEALASARRR